jgi:hypothetical protein
MNRRAKAILAAVVLALCLAPRARAAGQVTTCVSVEAPPAEHDALERLVTSEVDRHATHRSATGNCSTHLRVELLEVQNARFLTGRVGGEVPQRVPVEGKDGRALERAVTELLRIVLGNDPVVLHAPGEQSFFGARVLELKELGKNTFDVSAVETVNLVSGRAAFLPGVQLGFTREVSSWQIGIEGMFAQRLDGHAGRLDLESMGRLHISGSLYFSRDADVSGFAGVALGVAYQRFRGPRGEGLGKGDGEYSAVGPGIGLRGGVEFFRSTVTRGALFVEAFLPMFVADDADTEIVRSWVPGLTLGAVARF